VGLEINPIITKISEIITQIAVLIIRNQIHFRVLEPEGIRRAKTFIKSHNVEIRLENALAQASHA
jgi:hypothetical protein